MGKSVSRILGLGLLLLFPIVAVGLDVGASDKADIERPNIIFVLTDDQRFDALGFLNPSLSTPNMDRLATQGVFFKNAFVTTSLCSPSRASILTGLYAHAHGVVDNHKQNLQPGTTFFPQYLNQAGYQTAYVGKWHMGRHTDEKQPGFDYWVSFVGQGSYLPARPEIDGGGQSWINVDGKRVKQKGYITDELTDYALDWLGKTKRETPFFLYLSHKAVHGPFIPADRHKALYQNVEIAPAPNQDISAELGTKQPRWVKDQRNSFLGADFPYHTDAKIEDIRMDYRRSLSAVDDSLGRILKWIESKGLSEKTLVIFMGDNGFLFGEHGLIDKRNAYEESMRVPLLAYMPGILPANTVVTEMVANIDIAPTILDVAQVQSQHAMHGRSMLPLAMRQPVEDWREALFYEYFWEWTFPHTPTTFALREDRYKLIQYHGVWDTDELYDLQADPYEKNNLIAQPEYRDRVREMRKDLYAMLVETDGEPVIPYTRKEGLGIRFRDRFQSGEKAADFPESFLKKPNAPDREDYKE